jgi:outer membrane receptor protein involved in Fe transport
MTTELPLGELRLRALAYAIAATLAAGTAANVSAQQAPAPASQPNSLEEITVTGTRIQHSDYVSPNPVNTFDAQKMQNLGLVNVADVITQIPSNVSQFQASTTGGSAFFVGSTLANLRGLNPFFGTRTLTLVDSRRFIPTTQGDSVDLNFIPSILIDRTEVVTGGASAAYGSGAVSGVVNILLDNKLEGLKLDLDMGQSGQGDGDNYHVGVAGGMAFGDQDRGHFVVGGEYQKQDVIQSCSDARDWCSKGVGLFSNNSGFSFGAGQPYTAKVPGQPADSISSNLRANQTSHTGVIFNNAAGATTTSQFNTAGTDIVPFSIGSFGYLGAGGTTIGGDGEPTYKNLSLYPEVERKTVYGHAEFDFTDSLTGFFDLSWGNVVGVNHQWAAGQNTANTCIRADNAYLGTMTQAARNAIAARAFNSPFTCFGTNITKDWSEQNNQTVTTDTEVTRFVVGLEGDINEKWSWDAYYQNGKTTRDQIGDGYQTNWRYQMAADAIIGPNGQPACRAVVTGQVPDATVDPSLIAGCQPLNPFGMAASQAALNYAFGDLTESNIIHQDVIAGTLSGQLWKGWSAGPLMGAFGAEYRSEDLANNAGNLPRPQRTDFSLQYGDSFAGETNVKEAFLELEMPFLRDLPGAQLLTLNVAGRRSEYENIGKAGTSGETGTQSFTTWKAAFVYDPVEWLRFRGSRSQDLRAASFRELYYSQSIPPGGIFGYVQNPVNPAGTPTFFGDPSWQILSGNPQLKPEESLTETFGLVISPGGGAEGMHISADYYEITISGGQRRDGAATVINACFQRNDPVQCGRIKFGPPISANPRSNIDEVNVPYINASPYTAKGIDYSFDYPLQLANGTIGFNFTATQAIDLLFQDTISLAIRDVAGQSGGGFGFLPDVAPAPEWIGNMIVTYARDRFSITGQARFTGDGKLDLLTPRTGPGEPGYNPGLTGSVSNNNVPSHTTFNLSGSYDLKLASLERMQLFGSITNLFDKDPPFSGNNGFGVGGVNAAFFDTLGRTYRIGLRMTF